VTREKAASQAIGREATGGIGRVTKMLPGTAGDPGKAASRAIGREATGGIGRVTKMLPGRAGEMEGMNREA
jgi:hypothetical protein